jgi:hypothetical protein
MQKRSKLSKRQQKLATDWLPLVKMLARFFVQNRPHWQRSVYVDDLEGEGYLALTKAARTYDPARLPYPKAYFARAIMNAMYKSIKRTTRTPGDWKVSLEEAAELVPVLESPDYLGLAISDLGEDSDLASDRFQEGHTLRQIAGEHQISLRLASVRSREIARRLATALDIRLQPREPRPERMPRDSKNASPSCGRASGHLRGKDAR